MILFEQIVVDAGLMVIIFPIDKTLDTILMRLW